MIIEREVEQMFERAVDRIAYSKVVELIFRALDRLLRV